VLAVIGVVGTLWNPLLGYLVVAAQVGPIGLGVRGRTSPLSWTDRLKRVAGMNGTLAIIGFVIGGLIDSAFVVAIGLFFLPPIVDVALLLLDPVERRLGGRWVEKAAGKLRASGARVVAITGSYGKTTTKAYVGHLLEGRLRTVSSPASFNNRMGLARAINEQLVPGTEVFIAEMGTYGPGEIADLCDWIPPDVAAIVAIGPVHLERFRTEERIVAAKSEILDRAKSAVIAIDHPLLRAVADARSDELEVITVSAGGREATVQVEAGRLLVNGTDSGAVERGTLDANLGVAIGICLALGLELRDLATRLHQLPRPEHRQSVSTSERGFRIIDDTYNSNPAGTVIGLDLLEMEGAAGRKVVVTPGMVEMGPKQSDENVAFAARASLVADDIVVVSGTNRTALLEGAKKGSASVTVVASRDQAVDWVRQNLGPGDAVLYENDLPDHYP
jgi:UDP-N-acetylmuramoyl-tripeptide--D-alanyl-D-alanine ligase